MQVRNVLHAARWKCRTQKITKNSPSAHHRTTLSGHIFKTKAHIDNQKKTVKQHYLFHMSPQYAELRPTKAEICWRVSGTPVNFNWFRVLAALLHGTQVVGVSQTSQLWTEGATYSAGRPSRWALAYILVYVNISQKHSYSTIFMPITVNISYTTIHTQQHEVVTSTIFG